MALSWMQVIFPQVNLAILFYRPALCIFFLRHQSNEVFARRQIFISNDGTDLGKFGCKGHAHQTLWGMGNCLKFHKVCACQILRGFRVHLAELVRGCTPLLYVYRAGICVSVLKAFFVLVKWIYRLFFKWISLKSKLPIIHLWPQGC